MLDSLALPFAKHIGTPLVPLSALLCVAQPLQTTFAEHISFILPVGTNDSF